MLIFLLVARRSPHPAAKCNAIRTNDAKQADFAEKRG